MIGAAPIARAKPPSAAVRQYVVTAARALQQQITAVAYIHRASLQRDLGGSSARVLVLFSVDRNGHVSMHRIYRSSGDPRFDDDVLRWTTPMTFPPFPASIKRSRLAFVLPVVFAPRP
ncbi:TonB family protein [Acidiphilium sp. AL]|uniref:TonB family protein n=1 Tax=Acidiphilium iwatense TaxID=768198 RepID=A0ABS9DTZ0_9PROT|nr:MULTISPECIES: TonB family protein [Acidiphilium]MCF3946193.1 TonB family protein [Acidiphilium iwatense]MCU4158765.1 TonB family protein [Acidiphilium sp. AL]